MPPLSQVSAYERCVTGCHDVVGGRGAPMSLSLSLWL